MGNYTVDLSKTIKFDKRLHHTIDLLQFHFGSMTTQLPTEEKELHQDIYKILKELQQFKNTILIKSLQEYDGYGE